MSFARVYVVILMATIYMVAAARTNNLDVDVFEELHVVRTSGDSAHGRTSSSHSDEPSCSPSNTVDDVPGVVARIAERDIAYPRGGMNFNGPTDLVITLGKPTNLVIPGVTSVTESSSSTVATPKSSSIVATPSASVIEVTSVIISLPSREPSATLSVDVNGTSTETEPCPSSIGVTSTPVPFVYTSTETIPCPNATAPGQSTVVVVTISCSSGPCRRPTAVPPPVSCSGNCPTEPAPGVVKAGTTLSPSSQPTGTGVIVPCSGKCPTEPAPGVVKAGTTLSTGSQPIGTGASVPCSGSGCPVPCSGPKCVMTVPASGAPGASGTPVACSGSKCVTAAGAPSATNALHTVSPTTSVPVYNGAADLQSGFMPPTIMVAFVLVVFLNAV